MGWVVLTIIMGILVAIAMAVSLSAKKQAKSAAAAKATQEQSRYSFDNNDDLNYNAFAKGSKLVALALAGLWVVLTLFFSIGQVGTKEIGVVTSFGATSGHRGSGPYMVWPWEKITEMDAAIQTDSYSAANGDQGPPVSVRIGNQQLANISVSIRWRINPTYADTLFQDYRTFKNVQDSLVTRDLYNAVSEQFANYNPLNNIASSYTVSKPNVNLNEFAKKIAAQMKSEIGNDGIEVLSVILPAAPTFDDATQQRISLLQSQFAQTLIAEQQIKTNAAQAEANKKLASSVNTSPNVLVAECLKTFDAMVKSGQLIPIGFTCWPGSGLKSGIIVNTGK